MASLGHQSVLSGYLHKSTPYLFISSVHWMKLSAWFILKFSSPVDFISTFQASIHSDENESNDPVKKSGQISVTVIIVTVDDEGLKQWWQE